MPGDERRGEESSGEQRDLLSLERAGEKRELLGVRIGGGGGGERE